MLPYLALLTACLSSGEEEVSDTDVFAPDAVGEEVVTTHIPSDLRGVWEARVPQVLERKVAVLKAGIDRRDPSRFDPPLSEAEQVWYDQAADPEHPYRAWYRCSQTCRFEISDSAIWNFGYHPYSMVGSGLMTRPEIHGREVDFVLEDHDPNGMRGRIHLRMNPEWTAFRVVEFDLDGYRDPHLGQKLELYYERRTTEVR